jgi:hypothetical protein
VLSNLAEPGKDGDPVFVAQRAIYEKFWSVPDGVKITTCLNELMKSLSSDDPGFILLDNYVKKFPDPKSK